MGAKKDAKDRVAQIDERLRSIESGNEQADADEVARLNSERESLLNRVDDELSS